MFDCSSSSLGIKNGTCGVTAVNVSWKSQGQGCSIIMPPKNNTCTRVTVTFTLLHPVRDAGVLCVDVRLEVIHWQFVAPHWHHELLM